jgi:hypothetical protein
LCIAGLRAKSDAADVALLVPDRNIVVRQLGIVGVAGLLEVQVKHVGFRQIDNTLQIQLGHILFRCSNRQICLVRNAVMTNPP